MEGLGIPFQGIAASETAAEIKKDMDAAKLPLRPETREAFMKALDGLRAAGATVVFDDSILGNDFAVAVGRVGTIPYIREGTEKFLEVFGPAQYHSAEEYLKVGWIASACDYHRRQGSRRAERPASLNAGRGGKGPDG